MWLRARPSGLGSGGWGVGVWLGECGWLVWCVAGLIWGGGVITTPRMVDSLGWVWDGGWWVGEWWWLRARQSGFGSGVCGVGVWLGEWRWLV